FFEQKIRPVLVEHCYKCHSAQAKSPKGGLLLDSREGLLKGGDSGQAVVPGKPDAGLLLKAVRYTDEALRMPPKGKLPDAVVADLEKWTAPGAPAPPTSSTSFKIVAAPPSARNHWAFQRIQGPPIPGVRDTAWPRTPVDHFVLARLEERGLS